MNSFNQVLTVILTVTLLAGCGGGTSSDTDDTTQNSNNTTQNSNSTGSTNNTTDTSNNTGTSNSTDNNTTTTATGFKGKRSYSTTDGYSVDITGMAIGSCSGPCFIVRGGQITADKKPLLITTKDKNWNIIRLLSDGKSVDTSFASNGVLNISGLGSVPQHGWNIDSQNRLSVLTKDYWNIHSVSRYSADGALDTSFATGGTLTSPTVSNPSNLYTLQDGRLLIGGSYTAPYNNLSYESQWAFTLLTETGAKDSATPQAGYFIVSQPNPTNQSQLKDVIETSQYLYLLGTTSKNGYAIGRLNKIDMTVDTSFGTNGFVEVVESTDAVINDLLIDSKGRVVVVGSVLDTGRVNFNNAGMAYAIYRYLADGSADTSFSNDGMTTINFGFNSSQTHQINDSATAVFEEGTKLIITGQSGSITRSTDRTFSMVRLLEDGTIDSTFEIGANQTKVDKHSTKIYFNNTTSEQATQSLILDDQQGRLVGYGVVTDQYGNINKTTPLRVQWWD